MSAHIPEHRRAINGRTFDREWRPEAIEHHRREVRRLGDAADSVIVLFALCILIVWFVLALAGTLGG